MKDPSLLKEDNNMVMEVGAVWHDVAEHLRLVMNIDESVDGYQRGDQNELLNKQEVEYQEAMVLGQLKHQVIKVKNSSVRRVRVDALCNIVDTMDTVILGEGEKALLRVDNDIDHEVSDENLQGAKIAVKRHDLWYILGKELTLLVQQCLENRKQYWSDFSSDNTKHCTTTIDVLRKSHQAVDDELWYMMMLYCRGLSIFPEIKEEATHVKIYKDILEILMDATWVHVLVQYELEERTAVSCIEALVGLQEYAPFVYVDLIQNERIIEIFLDKILRNSFVPEQVRIAAAKAVMVMMQEAGKSNRSIDKDAELPSSPEAISHAEPYDKVEIARKMAKDYIFTRLSREGAMLATSGSVANSNNGSKHLNRRASALAMLLLHTDDDVH